MDGGRDSRQSYRPDVRESGGGSETFKEFEGEVGERFTISLAVELCDYRSSEVLAL